MMNTASIQYRLLSVIFIMSLCVIIVGVLSAFSLTRLTASFREFTRTQMPIIRSTQQAILALESAGANVGYILSLGSSEDIEEARQFEADYNQSILQFETLLAALTWGSETEKFRTLDGGLVFSEWKRYGYQKKYTLPPAQGNASQAAEKMHTFIGAFVTKSHEIFALKKKILRLPDSAPRAQRENVEEQLETLIFDMRKSKESITTLLQTFIAESEAAIDTDLKTHEQLTASVYTIILVIIGISVLFAGLFGTFYTRTMILLPIQNLTRIVNDISKGKLDARIDPAILESKDEIGDLARAFDRTVVSLKLAMRQTGQASPPVDAKKQENP